MRASSSRSSLTQVLFRTLGVAILVIAGFMSRPAHAWPDHPVRVVVPFSAGGTTDLLARLLAEGIAPYIGQSVIVVNKGGAGGNIGAAEVARSTPDGYTLLLGTPGTQVTNNLVYKAPGYDSEKDFSPVAFVARVANVVITTPSTGLKNMDDLIREAKEHPGQLNWGTPGIGSSGHLSLELIKQKADIDITHIPYKGAGQARNDLLAGTIALGSDNLPTALAAIKAGQLVALGVSSARPDPALPNVRPIGDAIPNYELSSWFVVMAPVGTPQNIVKQLNEAINKWLEDPKTAAKLAALAATPMIGTPGELATFLQGERTKYAELTQAAGIKPQ